MRDVLALKNICKAKKKEKKYTHKYNNYKYGKLKLQKMAATKLQV